ncbi:hypothetical protein AB837_00445 [bacterium AB1]|nr:hypothetical protein AB837_00445 [bacterium AB1]
MSIILEIQKLKYRMFSKSGLLVLATSLTYQVSPENKNIYICREIIEKSFIESFDIINNELNTINNKYKFLHDEILKDDLPAEELCSNCKNIKNAQQYNLMLRNFNLKLDHLARLLKEKDCNITKLKSFCDSFRYMVKSCFVI